MSVSIDPTSGPPASNTGTTLLLEPFGGMAGDMFLAALLDLGRPEFTMRELSELAHALVPGECVLSLTEVKRKSLRARSLRVETAESVDPPHRHLTDLLALLDAGGLTGRARARAERILRRIAAAEASVHGVPEETVHFHEVGAVDTLVDVCGAVHALDRLEVERVVSTVPFLGGGTVECAHGEMPVPAPGTAALLAGIPVRNGPGGDEGERVTPTGAALLAELVDSFEPGEALRALSIGYGAGTRDPAQGPPNLLRVSACVPASPPSATEEVWLLECNLDDATGEEVGFLLGELRRLGALEAWSAPIHMKKDRPGTLVSALVRRARRAALEDVCFAHSPTLGVRWSPRERTECEREVVLVPFEGRQVRVVVRHRPQTPLRSDDFSPEFDDLAVLARESGRSLRVIEEEIRRRACAELAARER